jgi:hypothetical protein
MVSLDEAHRDFTYLEITGPGQEEQLDVKGIPLDGRLREKLLRGRSGKPFKPALSVFDVHVQEEANEGREALARQFSEQGPAGLIGGFGKVSCPGNHIALGCMKNFDALKKCVEVIGEVRIRKEAMVASGFQHACPDRISFSLVGFKVNGPQKRGCQALDDLSGIVRAPVVDKNDFICLKVLLTEAAQSFEALYNPFLLVVTGNDDGYEIRHFRHEPRNRANLCIDLDSAAQEC